MQSPEKEALIEAIYNKGVTATEDVLVTVDATSENKDLHVTCEANQVMIVKVVTKNMTGTSGFGYNVQTRNSITGKSEAFIIDDAREMGNGETEEMIVTEVHMTNLNSRQVDVVGTKYTLDS